MPAAAIPAIIGAGASVGSSLIGAGMQSKAAKNAAKTQQQSADQAMALQYQMMQRAEEAQRQQQMATQQLYSPYTQSAPLSLAALNDFVGIPNAPQGRPGMGFPGGQGGPMMKPPGTPAMGGPPLQQFGPGGPGGPPMRGMPPGGPGMAVPRRPMPMSQMYG